MKGTKWVSLLLVMIFMINMTLSCMSVFGTNEEFLVVAGEENFSQTGVWKKSSSALAHDGAGAPGSLYSSDGSGNAKAVFSLPSEAPDGIYEISYYLTAAVKQEVTIHGEQDKVVTLENSSAEKQWIKLDGSYTMRQGGQASVTIRRYSSAEGGGMARATSIKFVKIGEITNPDQSPKPSTEPTASAGSSQEPSIVPSIEPSTQPSAEPSIPAEPQVFCNLNLKESPEELENWTANANVSALETEIPDKNEKSIQISQTTSSQGTWTRTFTEPVSAPQMVLDTVFTLIDGKNNQIVIRNSAKSSKVSMQIDFAEKNNTEYSICYYDGSSQKTETEYTLKKAHWYRMIAVYEAEKGTYSLYFYNNQGERIITIEHITANKGTAVLPADIGRIVYYVNEKESRIYLNSLKLFYEPDYAVPQTVPSLYPPVESLLPSPKPSPDPNLSFYDDEQTDIFEMLGLPEELQGDDSKGTSTTGSASMGTQMRHTYSNIVGSYMQYTLKDTKSGQYELYFNVPLVHSSNTNQMYIEVTDSTGKKVRKVYDIKEGSVPGQNAAGDIKTGTMLKLGGDFVFNTQQPGVVKVGLAVDEKAFYRADTVKLVRIQEIIEKPYAKNIAIQGLLKPSAVLKGTYQYIQDNGYNEQGSILKWYRGEAGQWTEIGTGDTYTVSKDDIGKQIKFEVIPKSDAADPGIQTGEAAEAITEVIPATDLPGTADEIKLDGKPLLGQTLTAEYTYHDANLDPEGDTVYQWYAGTQNGQKELLKKGTCKAGEPITYTLTENEIGKYIRLGITVKSSDLTAEEVFSEVTGPVEVTKPSVKNVIIKGSLKPGSELTVKYDYSQPDDYKEKNSQIQWYRLEEEWKKVADGDRYRLTEEDVGRKIKVEVIPQCAIPDGSVLTGDAMAAETAEIPNKDYPGEAYDIKIDGSPLSYLTLQAEYSYRDINLDPEGETTFCWYRSDKPDAGYTKLADGIAKAGEPIELLLTPEDIGKYIKLGITVKSAGQTAQEVFSQIIGPVEKMPEKMPSVRLAAISGALTPDRPVQAFYVYEQESGLPEGESQIQWYVSDQKNGDFAPIEGAVQKEYQPTEEQMYQYLKFIVTPVSSQTGWTGEPMESEPRQIKWKLTWFDEFDYTAKDGNDPAFTAKWKSDNSNPAHIASARYPENVSVSDGTLKLHQRREPGIAPGKNWTSGSVWTKERTFGYGYYEAKYKFAPATGLNQSFWLFTGNAGTLGGYEIDVNEGHYPRTINSNIHYNRPKADLPEGADLTLPQNRELVKTHDEYRLDYVDNMADQYHVFGMDWNENEILMYCDGNLYRRMENKDPQCGEKLCDPVNGQKASIYFSVAVLSWAGGISQAIDGSVMEVDYIRYYQQEKSVVDKEGLYNALERAEKAAESAIIGNQVFEYPAKAVETLQTAVESIQLVAGNSGATAKEVNEAIAAVNDAVEDFYGKMNTSGVLNTESNTALIPEMFGREVSVTSLTKDAALIANANQPISKAIQITSLINDQIIRKPVVITLPAYTRFSGTTGETVKIPLPHTETALESTSIPGKVETIVDMGSAKVSDPVRILLPDCAGKTIGYIDDHGNFVKLETVVSEDKQTTADGQLKAGEMGYIANEGTGDLIIWSKILSPIILYTPKNTTPGIIGGGGMQPYYPSPTAEPSEPAISPSVSPAADPGFTDISGHWAEKEIEGLAEKGIIKGMTETEFMPDKAISRAEFTALAVRTLGLKQESYQEVYSDVKKGDWFADDVQTALVHGIISEDDAFRPYDTVTREEMAKIMSESLMRALETDELKKADTNHFTDRGEISPWAQNYIEMALGSGLMQGISETEFAPVENATRAQAAVLLWRFLERLE